MTVLAPPPHRHDTDKAQLLFREARRRRRRLRTIWAVVAIAVLGCAVGLGFGLHVSPRSGSQPSSVGTQPQSSRHVRTGVTLVYAFNNLRVIDADTGTSRTLPMPAPYGGSRDLGMVRVGNSLLLNRGDTAWLYSNGVAGSPTDLGPSDGVFAGPNRNEAWVWSQPCQPTFGCANYNAPQMGSVHLVNASGTEIGSPVQLPGGAGWFPTGLGGNAGIVLSELPEYGDHENAEEIWNPLTDHVVRVNSTMYVIGAAGNLVVSDSRRYCSGEFTACSVRITNLSAGTNTSVRLPEGIAVDGDAAISPDRRTIALTAALSRAVRTPYPDAIVLINVRTGDATVLDGSQQMTNPNWGPMSLTWSTNGWLFSDKVGTSVVHAWQPGETRAWVLPRVKLPKLQLVNEDPALIAL